MWLVEIKDVLCYNTEVFAADYRAHKNFYGLLAEQFHKNRVFVMNKRKKMGSRRDGVWLRDMDAACVYSVFISQSDGQ